MTFAGRFVSDIIRFAASRGVDPQSLIGLTGLDWPALTQESCRVTEATYSKVMQAVMDATEDDSVGFRYGMTTQLAAAGLITQLVQTSATVAEALQQACHFYNLGCQAIPLELRTEEDGLWFSMVPHPQWQHRAPEVVRHTAEGMLVFQWRLVQSLTHQAYHPKEVWVASPAHGREALFERIFEQPVRFSAPGYALRLHAEQVTAPVLTHDFRLQSVLVAHAESLLARMGTSDTLAHRIRGLLLQGMAPSIPGIEAVADMLHVSVRTLQRRLGAEGTSYKQLVEELRQTLSQEYLHDAGLSISQVADLLGYAEVSVFSRSFRRWHGHSPQAYRQGIR